MAAGKDPPELHVQEVKHLATPAMCYQKHGIRWGMLEFNPVKQVFDILL